ncbi:hypothetical protein ACHQM5_014704 [Ranunculus cassubicifolius]
MNYLPLPWFRQNYSPPTTIDHRFFVRLISISEKSVDGLSPKNAVDSLEGDAEEEGSTGRNSSNGLAKEEVPAAKESKSENDRRWAQIRPSLGTIEKMMSTRVKDKSLSKEGQDTKHGNHLAPIVEPASEEDSDDEFYDVERSVPIQEASPGDNVNSPNDGLTTESSFPCIEELEVLVRGGVPMSLRGEIWQAFVGVRTRRVERYYQDLLAREVNVSDAKQSDSSLSDDTSKKSSMQHGCAPEKWKGPIEKDLPRTFPGHPALDEDGRNALRRLLTAYARHNPSVGYCQAMNFFAGLLLLLMPFWALLGIMDDYFDGYYSEEMIESQVDQLVFEELVRERFPKLVNHLDYLGVEVAWVTGPWFLSIFVNMLPWESVLRVWDVLLFEGNRVMLFQTSLALMDLYGPALVTTKDAGDAITLLQSLAGSTFDSSQLVLTACMGYQGVNEARLQELRDKHRPSVMDSLEERAKGMQCSKDSRGLASNLYSFKHDPASLISNSKASEGADGIQTNGGLGAGASDFDEFLNGLTGDSDGESLPDLQEQTLGLCKVFKMPMSVEREFEMALQDSVMEETKDKKNAVEAYVYETRNKLNDKYFEFVTQTEREELITKLQEVEDWLYEDGEDETKGVYIAKLEELKMVSVWPDFGPIFGGTTIFWSSFTYNWCGCFSQPHPVDK